MRHAVIMAGGSGTRLWPLSRKMRPKQLMRLFEGASLLQLARRRLAELFRPENTWVITSANYIDLVADELPDLPRENLIGEPMGRDTANAVGLAAYLIAQRDPDATMAVFTADHMISPQAPFEAAIRQGLDAAERFGDALITFGITPTEPHTGYGYIRRGMPVGTATFQVAEFREKPTRDVAEAYLRSGEYLWNSGMFAWRVAAIRRELEHHLPENARRLSQLAADWSKPAAARDRAEKFGELPRISIDYGVMEKASNVLTVEMSCRWIDLGTWTAIASAVTPDRDGNRAVGARSIVIDGRDNIVVSETGHVIVTLGLSNIIVVQSGDVTLVCQRDKEQAIRDLAGRAAAQFGPELE